MPLYVRLIYTVFSSLPAGNHRQNELKVIWIIFHENLAVKYFKVNQDF